MSRTYRDLAWLARYRAEKKLVLLYLAERANDEGLCWPSIEAIAEACEITERGAYKIIATLIGDGVLSKISAGGGKGKSNIYQIELRSESLNPGTGFKERNPEPQDRVSDVETLNGATQTLNTGTGYSDVNPEPGDRVSSTQTLNEKTQTLNEETQTLNEETSHIRKNRHENRHENRQSRHVMSSSANSTGEADDFHKVKPNPQRPDRSEEIGQIFDYWRQILNHPKSRLDEKRKQKIRARLAEGFEVNDLKLAIEGCSKSPFHQGENNHSKVFDDIELICRDAAHVERFMSYAIRPPERNGKARDPSGQGKPMLINPDSLGAKTRGNAFALQEFIEQGKGKLNDGNGS
jgi:hypothetical protein